MSTTCYFCKRERADSQCETCKRAVCIQCSSNHNCYERQGRTALLVGMVLSALIAFPAHAALKPGDKAQAFSAKASLAGKELEFSLKSALKKGPIVLYFYPAAFTKGCSLEAHGFAENKEKFE